MAHTTNFAAMKKGQIFDHTKSRFGVESAFGTHQIQSPVSLKEKLASVNSSSHKNLMRVSKHDKSRQSMLQTMNIQDGAEKDQQVGGIGHTSSAGNLDP